VELDLLYQLQQICEKYGIKYCASGGTILGAVRHKGFIPWDDDIDIMMMRDQYEELCKHADDFKKPYFFQNAYRDAGYLYGHAQLRNSNTTAVLKLHEHSNKPYNQGIFIDIFPIDAIPDSEDERKNQASRVEKYRNMAKKQYNAAEAKDSENASLKRKIAHPIFKVLNRIYPYMNFYKKFEDECRKYNSKNTKLVSKLCLKSDDKKLYQDRTDFDSFVMMDFEMLKIPVPSSYDRLLRYKYGDYMKFVRGQNYHGGIIFDVDTPYNTIING
jgi:lipopolysaccharide cholinephosphotransferase